MREKNRTMYCLAVYHHKALVIVAELLLPLENKFADA